MTTEPLSKRLWNTQLSVILALVATILLLATACGSTLRMYAGPERPFHDIALVKVPHLGSAVVKKIDDKEIPWMGAAGFHSRAELPPGVHTLIVSYTSGDLEYVYRSTLDCVITFTAEAKRIYRVRTKRYGAGPGRMGSWRAWLVDEQTDATVATCQ